jgi:hypothetical protein
MPAAPHAFIAESIVVNFSPSTKQRVPILGAGFAGDPAPSCPKQATDCKRITIIGRSHMILDLLLFINAVESREESLLKKIDLAPRPMHINFTLRLEGAQQRHSYTVPQLYRLRNRIGVVCIGRHREYIHLLLAAWTSGHVLDRDTKSGVGGMAGSSEAASKRLARVLSASACFQKMIELNRELQQWKEIAQHRSCSKNPLISNLPAPSARASSQRLRRQQSQQSTGRAHRFEIYFAPRTLVG